MQPTRPASSGDAAALLDLLALTDTSDASMWTLTAQPPATREALVSVLCPTGDRSTRMAVVALLEELDVTAGPLSKQAVATLASTLALAAQLRATITARAPAPHSSLVVTATGSPELQHLQQALGFIPLFQLVEDVIRSATNTCWLGAPYWNADAIERLSPALGGFARRGGHVELVGQGGAANGDADPLPVLRRAAVDIAGAGGTARVWAFVTRSARGQPLLLHAKFALADRSLGYLGSANMTRQGFGDHFEIGIRLPDVEAAHLVTLLERLCAAGLLQEQL
jgi:phosphatidylserine/phosphatidylglycerophosphate/cardiolipin synthase-like enzyme